MADLRHDAANSRWEWERSARCGLEVACLKPALFMEGKNNISHPKLTKR